MFWWAYFAFIPDVGEHTLREAQGPLRAVLARDLYTFGHVLLVFGLILYAVVVKHLVPHPDGRLAVDDRWLLALSVVCFVGGLLVFQYRIRRALARERLLALPAAAGLAVLGRYVPGLLVVGLMAILLGVMQTITWRRFRQGALAYVATNR